MKKCRFFCVVLVLACKEIIRLAREDGPQPQCSTAVDTVRTLEKGDHHGQEGEAGRGRGGNGSKDGRHGASCHGWGVSPVPACLPRHAACIANVSPFFFALARTGSLHFVSAARRANVWEACACVRVNVRNMAAMTSSAACWSTATSLPGGQRFTRHCLSPFFLAVRLRARRASDMPPGWEERPSKQYP